VTHFPLAALRVMARRSNVPTCAQQRFIDQYRNTSLVLGEFANLYCHPSI
jgi:hypothetical protein